MKLTTRQRKRAAKIWMYSLIVQTDDPDSDLLCDEIRRTARDMAHAELVKMGAIAVDSETAAIDAAGS